jgi:hypothetical protein
MWFGDDVKYVKPKLNTATIVENYPISILINLQSYNEFRLLSPNQKTNGAYIAQA